MISLRRNRHVGWRARAMLERKRRKKDYPMLSHSVEYVMLVRMLGVSCIPFSPVGQENPERSTLPLPDSPSLDEVRTSKFVLSQDSKAAARTEGGEREGKKLRWKNLWKTFNSSSSPPLGLGSCGSSGSHGAHCLIHGPWGIEDSGGFKGSVSQR
jgi:hypothetical protein